MKKKCELTTEERIASAYAKKSTDEKRYAVLSWLILEHKCRYYYYNKPIIQDYEYDMLEKEYDALADKLSLPKSASDMIDFDESKQSCRLVIRRIAEKEGDTY